MVHALVSKRLASENVTNRILGLRGCVLASTPLSDPSCTS